MKAFPSYNDSDKQYNYINKGMDLRDYFAARAMQSYIENQHYQGLHEELVMQSYKIADMMLHAREIK